MKKEEFVALGIDEGLAEKAAEASKKELDGAYVPKTRFNEVNEEKKQLESDIKERDTQLETLKNSADDVEDMKKKIETLQTENRDSKEKHEQEMRDLRLATAIKLSLSGKVHDEDLVAGLFDKEKLVLGDDGKVVGLEEQIKTLKESKGFLFKEEGKEQETKSGFRVGATNTQNTQNEPGKGMSMKEAISARLQTQIGQVKE